MAKNTKTEFNDLGLATKIPSSGYRSLNKDGSFNVKKVNISFSERFNIYHALISKGYDDAKTALENFSL